LKESFQRQHKGIKYCMVKRNTSSTDFIKEKVSAHLRRADELVRRKQYNDALMEIEAAFELDSKNMYIRSFMERTRYLIQKENEKKTDAFGEIDTVIERRMQTISRLLASAEEFIRLKLYHRALAAVAKVYQIDPKNHYAQLFSERIEELMQAEEGNKGKAGPSAARNIKSDSFAPSVNVPSTPIPEDIPQPVTPLQSDIPRPPIQVRYDISPSAQKMEPPVPESKTEPLEDAGRFALYRELLRECWADGVITPEESAMLHRVRSQYSISFEQHCRLEVDIKIDAYVDALRIVWRDSVVTDNEQEVLEIMRKKFGITPEDQAAAEKKFSYLNTTNEARETILIVDPDQDDLISIARALIGSGYDVRVVRHPDEAIRFMQTNTPDLILSEVVFPQLDTDGFEFYQKVRSNAQWNHIPFLMMTYPGDARIVKAGLRMGVDYFLPKPLHIDFMMAIVEGKLKSGRQVSASVK
jgi:CheY-like chemotaxis protein